MNFVLLKITLQNREKLQDANISQNIFNHYIILFLKLKSINNFFLMQSLSNKF